MRRIAFTFILAAVSGLAGTASAQVVVGGQGNNSVIVDYSVLGLPGGTGGAYPGTGYNAYGDGPVMPNGTAPRSRIVAPEFNDGTGTTVIGSATAPAPVPRAAAPGVGSSLSPEAMALLGQQGATAPQLSPPPAAAPKPKVRATPPAPAPAPVETAKVEPKIEVTRPTPPAPPKPEAPEPAQAPEPKPEPKPEPVAAPAPPKPAAPEPAPAPAPPAPVAAPAPPAPAAPAPEAPTQVAKAEPGPAAELPGATTLAFAPGATDVPSESIGALEQIAAAAAQDESIRIQLLAYASAEGGPSSTARRISLRRALNVRKYLIEKDVRASRIDVRALGNRVPEGNPDRVEVSIVRR
jgi:outer membrane protein OmpA-like peptidoglycan-associated protein